MNRETQAAPQTQEQLLQLEDKVAELRDQGVMGKDICSRLSLTPHELQRVVRRLYKKNKTSSMITAQWLKGWGDLENERTKMLVDLLKKKTSLRAIGELLGLSIERVRQIKEKLIENYGEEIFHTDDQLLSLQEAAKILKVKRTTLANLCTAGRIAYKKEKERSPRYIAESELRRLLEQGLPPTRHPRAKWIEKLAKELKDYTPPDDEVWIGATEAKKAIGIHDSQLVTLRDRGILSSRDHTYYERPGKKYAKSEIEIAKRIRARYKK